jgi:hypothetical protein
MKTSVATLKKKLEDDIKLISDKIPEKKKEDEKKA